MTLSAPTYDLVLMLDVEVEEPARAKILADAGAAIKGQGELLRHDEWGRRELTYPIDHKTAAEYHLLQFHAGSPELLKGLDRSLRIADEVIRFRIVKLKPGTPAAPDMHAATATSRTTEAELGATTSATAEAQAETGAIVDAEPETSAIATAEPETSAVAEAEVEVVAEAEIEVEINSGS
jgi:small subunit ribosomal protein S6